MKLKGKVNSYIFKIMSIPGCICDRVMRKIEEKVLKKREKEPAEPFVRPWQVSIVLNDK
jgi:hypothetical protein